MSDIFEISATGRREYKVPTIIAANFEDWLDLMKTVLLSKNLWKYTDNSVVCVPGKAEEHEREDAKAAAYLKIVAGSKQLTYPRGLTSRKAILDKLKARYHVLQDKWLLSLCSQFHGFKSQGGIDLDANKLTLLQ